MDGSKTKTLGPRSIGLPGEVVGVGVGVPTVGRVHFWLAPPEQFQICSGVPSAELTPVASRHLLACGLRSWPEPAAHCCAPLPLQSQIWTLAPLAVEPAATSRHLPRARMVPSSPTVHCWAPVPLQL